MLVLASCLFGIFISTGFQRVHYVRNNYQLGRELSERERQIHHLEQAFHSLEAFVAVQSSRESQLRELNRNTVSFLKPKSRSKS